MSDGKCGTTDRGCGCSSESVTTSGPTTTSLPLSNITTETETGTKVPRRRFVGRAGRSRLEADGAVASEDGRNVNVEIGGAIEETAMQVAPSRRQTARLLNAIPDSITQDRDIQAAVGLLPANYSFEIYKTIHKIRSFGSKRVALQFPEGLLMFSTTISDILSQFCPGIDTLIIGDVTYGACCVDDFTARALECDLLVHYAHSCLIPVHVTKIKTLYVFVEIGIDSDHLRATVERNFVAGQKSIALVGTIQFNSALHQLATSLRQSGYSIIVPQIAPLSRGEILGCTSPNLLAGLEKPAKKSSLLATSTKSHSTSTDTPADCVLYVGDGRFHLESAMIHNPGLPAYRYDPYSRKLTREEYDHDELYSVRSNAISTARTAKTWGLILGTLGRQGNPATLAMIEEKLREKGVPLVRVLLSEIFPGKLAMMPEVECWVQVACPRLSIDWGYAFPRPLLSPYEALVALGDRKAGWMDGDGPKTYPMDYYAKDGLGRVAAAVERG